MYNPSPPWYPYPMTLSPEEEAALDAREDAEAVRVIHLSGPAHLLTAAERLAAVSLLWDSEINKGFSFLAHGEHTLERMRELLDGYDWRLPS